MLFEPPKISSLSSTLTMRMAMRAGRGSAWQWVTAGTGVSSLVMHVLSLTGTVLLGQSGEQVSGWTCSHVFDVKLYLQSSFVIVLLMRPPNTYIASP